MNKKSVSLVLGSGGARGMAHIGIIKWLEEHEYKIESISGASIGALVGGFYAAGKLDVYTKWLEEIDVIDMLKLLDFKGSGGFISGNTLMKKMKELIGDYQIEDFDIKFTAVASDIDAEKEVWISKGSLLEAIRASISLPLFFTPHLYKGRLLVDGGVLNPVPIAPTFHNNTSLTIAVNLGGEDILQEVNTTKKEDASFSQKIKDYMSNISLPNFTNEKNGIYSVADKSFEAMQSTIARMKLAAYPPDIEIEVPKNICTTFEFNRAKEIIEYGYNLCEKSFKEKEII
jgi:NTE family protein